MNGLKCIFGIGPWYFGRHLLAQVDELHYSGTSSVLGIDTDFHLVNGFNQVRVDCLWYMYVVAMKKVVCIKYRETECK